jgi:pimeloyl-ACP methyl ester carboxylesterase
MLHYHRLGHGPQVLLAFHGIGQDGRSCYQPFADALGHRYTLYAFDLFFHGLSTPAEEAAEVPLSITKSAWARLLREFLNQHHIQQFHVAGFSMGGRFALATAEAFPEQCRRVYLMAPDGVREHPLYHLSTRFPPARYLFRQVLSHPAPLFRAAGLLEKARLLPASQLRFVRHMLDTPAQRHTIYRSWVAFRHLRFNVPALYQHLQHHQVELYLLMGTYDQLLRPSDVRVLSRRLPPSQYVLLPSGHTQLVAKSAAFIATLPK